MPNITAEVRVNQTSVKAIEEELGGTAADAKKILVSAMNEAAKHGRTTFARGLREHLNLKYGDVLDRIKVPRQATANALNTDININYKPIPLSEYRARWSKKKGVTVTTVKDEGPQNFRHQFLVKGHGIFERIAGAKRYPIKKKFGPSVVAGFTLGPGLEEKAVKNVSAYFEKRLDSKIAARLSGKSFASNY